MKTQTKQMLVTLVLLFITVGSLIWLTAVAGPVAILGMISTVAGVISVARVITTVHNTDKKRSVERIINALVQ